MKAAWVEYGSLGAIPVAIDELLDGGLSGFPILLRRLMPKIRAIWLGLK